MAKTAVEMVEILTDAIANSATNGMEIQDENGRRKKFNTIGDMMKALKTWQDSAAAAANAAAGKSRFAFGDLSKVSL